LDRTPSKPAPGRLAFYIHSLSSGLGAEKVVVNVVSGLSARGHEIDLLVEETDGEILARLPAGVRVIDLVGDAHPVADPLYRFVSLAINFVRRTKPDPCGDVSFRVALARFLYKRRPPLYALTRYLRRRRPQAIVSFLNYPNLALLLAAQLGKGDARVYVNVRNHITSSVAGAKSRRMTEMPVLMRNLFSLADGVVAVSDGVARDIARLTDTPTDRVTTILNPVYRPEIFQLAALPAPHPWFASDGPPVVLAAGKMKPQKDFATLLRAFARLREERPARLVILGDGEGRDGLDALAVDLGVRDDVDFPGYVDNPYAFYRNAAVFVLSSAWEGLPNVLIEAMACGCPLVSTDCPSGPSEILDGGRLGRLVPVGDDAALADAITETLEETPRPGASDDYVKRFAFDRIVERYESLMSREDAAAQILPRPRGG
jgi:glycosyltransferase involved in cell wall biosynthesis